MRRYGLLGYPLTHSFSQRYFTEKFKQEGITDCSYSNFSLPDIGELTEILADGSLCGLNVTIPYKEKVIAFLDERSPVVEEIGACNCIRITGGRKAGYNTDVVGFEQSLVKKLGGHHREALVLGTGGAAKAVEYVLRKLGIGYRLVT
ncbi:MAG TPA: shikimate dehydrogenase, partial [Puia sp.]